MSPPYDASRDHLRASGLTGRDALRLFRALCTLVDYEGKVKRALSKKGHTEWAHHHVCDALRLLVDGE